MNLSGSQKNSYKDNSGPILVKTNMTQPHSIVNTPEKSFDMDYIKLNAILKLRAKVNEYLYDELKYDTLNNEIKQIKRKKQREINFHNYNADK